MACYYQRLKLVVMSSKKIGNEAKFIRNRLLHPLLRKEEEPDFDHIQLCSPDKSKLDSCFGDDQYIAYAMSKDETAYELSFSIIKAMFHQFIIACLINKRFL